MLDVDSTAYQYLRDHLKGASAKSIAAQLGGFGTQRGDYPHDADDFGRCEALLDAIPEFRDRLDEMAGVNAYWHHLVKAWPKILAADDRSAAIKRVIAPIEKLDPAHAPMGESASMRTGLGVSFSLDDYQRAGDATKNGAAKVARKKGKPPMKPDPDFDRMSADAYNVTAEELRQFVERYEHLEQEKKDITDQQKEVMAEAKGRGYDTKVLKKVIALRKRKPDELAEEQAVLDLYKTALGMV